MLCAAASHVLQQTNPHSTSIPCVHCRHLYLGTGRLVQRTRFIIELAARAPLLRPGQPTAGSASRLSFPTTRQAHHLTRLLLFIVRLVTYGLEHIRIGQTHRTLPSAGCFMKNLTFCSKRTAPAVAVGPAASGTIRGALGRDYGDRPGHGLNMPERRAYAAFSAVARCDS